MKRFRAGTRPAQLVTSLLPGAVLILGAVTVQVPGVSAAPAEASPEELLLGPAVVTPTRQLTPLIQTPASVRVITRQEMEAAGFKTVGEALGRLVGGVQDVEGSVSSYYSIRGYSSSSNFNERELILLDGQPLNDAVLSTFDPESIPAINVDHIEVVSGPGSALYGPDAFAGVINVITQSPTSHPRDTAEAFAGDSGDALAAMVSGSIKRLDRGADWTLSGLINKDVGLTQVANGDIRSGSFRGAIAVPQVLHGSLDVAAAYYGSDSGSVGYVFSSPPTPHDRLRYNFGTLNTLWQPTLGKTESHVRFYAEAGNQEARSERPLGSGMFSFLRATNTTYGVELQSRIPQGARDALLVGADLRRITSGGDVPAAAENLAGFAEEEMHFGRFSPRIGVRDDYHSVYGNRINPRLAATYELTPRVIMRASTGTAYRAPNFLELFIPSYVFNHEVPLPPTGALVNVPLTIRGNRALTPESTTATEIGIRAELGTGTTLDAAIFDNSVSDLITFVVPDPRVPIGTWANAGSGSIRGGEVSVGRALGAHARSLLQYAYVDAPSVSLNNPAAIALPGVTPHHQVVWHTYVTDFHHFHSSLIINARSGSQTRGGAAVTDFSIGHPLTKDLDLQLNVRNLFDVGYYVGETIPGAGRTLSARLAGRF